MEGWQIKNGEGSNKQGRIFKNYKRKRFDTDMGMTADGLMMLMGDWIKG